MSRAWRHLFLWIIPYHAYRCRAIGENTALLSYSTLMRLRLAPVERGTSEYSLCCVDANVGRFLDIPG